MPHSELTSRKIKADKTKRKIYDKAMRLFKKKGYESVKIVDICKAADISVGTFYYYFKSKEDIVEDGLLRHNDALKRSIDKYTPADPLSNIKNYITQQMKSIVKFNSQDLLIIYGYRLYLTAAGDIDMERNPTGLFLKNYLMKEVRSAIEEGLFKEGYTAEEIYETLRRQSRGCIYDWCLHNYKYDLLEIRLFDLDLMFKAILKDY